MIQFLYSKNMTVDMLSVLRNEPKVWILRLPNSIHDYPKTPYKILIIILSLISCIPNYVFAVLVVDSMSTLGCAIEVLAFSFLIVSNSTLISLSHGYYNLESRYKLFQILTEMNGISQRIEKNFKIQLSYEMEQKLMNYGLVILSFLTGSIIIYSLMVEVPLDISRGINILIAYLCGFSILMLGYYWILLSVLLKFVVCNILGKQFVSLKNVLNKETQAFRQILLNLFIANESLNSVYGLMVLNILFFGLGHGVIIFYGMLSPNLSCLMKNYSFLLVIFFGLILAIRVSEEKLAKHVSIPTLINF